MITTNRLDLVPVTQDSLLAALESPAALGNALEAVIPSSWPPEHLDDKVLRYSIDRLVEHPDNADWWLHWVLLRSGPEQSTLIGIAGYKGPPDADGTVEIGYSIVADRHRQGYATESVRGLIAHAFARPGVGRVIAETLPELDASIGVLTKCGFRFCGDGSEAGVVRFELLRWA